MRIRSTVLVLVLFGIAACASFRRGSSADQSQPTILQVDNQGFLDMTVFALRSGVRQRLGIAIGVTKTNLAIPPEMVGGGTLLRFVADPIGGRRASVSQEISVVPGDTVVMTIPPA